MARRAPTGLAASGRSITRLCSGGPMSTTSAPGAPHHRPGSDSPIKAVAPCRLGRHLPLRLGRVVSEFLYFAAWVGLAPFPILRDTVSSGPRLEKEWWSHVSGVAPSPKPTGSRLKDSSSDHELPLVALAERAGQSEALPALALAGVRNIAELAANTDRLVEAGISPVTLEAMPRPLRRHLPWQWRRLGRLGRICQSAGTPLEPLWPRRSRQFARPTSRGRSRNSATTCSPSRLVGPTSPGSGLGTAWRLRAGSPPGPSPPGHWR